MFIKSDIRKVTIALEKEFSNEVYFRLGRAGIVHLARVQDHAALTDTGITMERRTQDIIADSGFALNALQMEVEEDVAPDLVQRKRDPEQDAVFASKARNSLERLRHLRARIQDMLAENKEQLEYAEALKMMKIDPGEIKRVRLVRMAFGEVTEGFESGHTERPFIVAGSDGYVVGVAMPQNAGQMLEVLRGYGFNDKTAKISGASFEDLKIRESALRCRLKILDRYTERLHRSAGPELKRIFYAYKEYEQVLKAMRLSKASEKILFITGWVDARDKGKLVSILREICGERFVLLDRRDPEAPVRLMNIRLFKPFELIVRTMGMPANSEIDPTPLSAMTFVLFFGLMFGDLGQGLVLAVAGLVLKSMGQKRQRENMDQAGSILSVCGLSAAFCGILYGSLFSSDHLIPALWIHPAENIMDLFSVTILLGGAVIVMGLFINIINAIINADYAEALLGKRGVAVLILYGAILLLSWRYTSNRQMPEYWEIGAFILLPFLFFSLRGVVGPVLFKGKPPHDLAGYLAETIMDIVEIALSLFVNTISFIRVGAFALSHAGLGIVTFTLAGMADPALKSPAAIAILVWGNIFILAFEGLIVAIQSLRLEYYEFFSKFFKGSGLVFSPFVLKTKMSEV